MDTVYIETTVIGHIAGRIHPNPTIASQQHVTRQWWARASLRYELFISQLTIDECADGDAQAAKERLAVVSGINLIVPSPDAERLAELLVERNAVPAAQPRDALHISIAAVSGIQFIVTWNFKHLLNPHLQTKIANTCREGGFEPLVICTPQQLLETEDDYRSH